MFNETFHAFYDEVGSGSPWIQRIVHKEARQKYSGEASHLARFGVQYGTPRTNSVYWPEMVEEAMSEMADSIANRIQSGSRLGYPLELKWGGFGAPLHSGAGEGFDDPRRSAVSDVPVSPVVRNATLWIMQHGAIAPKGRNDSEIEQTLADNWASFITEQDAISDRVEKLRARLTADDQ